MVAKSAREMPVMALKGYVTDISALKTYRGAYITGVPYVYDLIYVRPQVYIFWDL